MNFTIVRGGKESAQDVSFEYQSPDSTDKRRPMVLDVLLQAETSSMPDLAYRYGCRNGICGVCTVEVNGKPKLACRTKVREGDRISALATLPLMRDLVVRRDAVNRQIMGKLPATPFNAEQAASTRNSSNEEYLSLHRCIECYACLSGCPLHEKNNHDSSDYEYGNPFSLLKLRTAGVNPDVSAEDRSVVNASVMELGLETCINCSGCSCGVGIDLRKEVIRPLLKTTGLLADSERWPKPRVRRGEDSSTPISPEEV